MTPRAELLLLGGLGRYRHIGILLLRVFLGFTLIYGTVDNVVIGERLLEFRDFLAGNGFPAPLASAYLSAYAQFICGILILLGLLTRWAAIIVAINFIVALGMVHVGLPFSQNISPLAMLFSALLFALYGGGPMSIDSRFEKLPAPGTGGLRNIVTVAIGEHRRTDSDVSG